MRPGWTGHRKELSSKEKSRTRVQDDKLRSTTIIHREHEYNNYHKSQRINLEAIKLKTLGHQPTDHDTILSLSFLEEKSPGFSIRCAKKQNEVVYSCLKSFEVLLQSLKLQVCMMNRGTWQSF